MTPLKSSRIGPLGGFAPLYNWGNAANDVRSRSVSEK